MHCMLTALLVALQRPAGQAPWQQFLWRCQKHALQGFVHVYPYAHSAIEAAKFGCQLMYLLDASAWHSPVLYCLRQQLVRMSGLELVSCNNRDKVAGEDVPTIAPQHCNAASVPTPVFTQ